MIKKCIICGVNFESMTNKKSCSLKCSNIQDKKLRKLYRDTHKVKQKEYSKNFKQKNPTYPVDYRNKNRIKLNKRQREWAKGKDMYKKYNLPYNKRWNNYKYKNDIYFKIKVNIRTRIYSALKNNSKSPSSIKLLGSSIEEYKKYLENQFDERMNWDNQGNKKNTWQIDHIIPLNTFDLSKSKEQLKAFNYKNTRPLWFNEHIKRPLNGDDIQNEVYKKC